MDARVCHEMLFVAVLTHKHTHTVCHEMLFVAVFAYSLGIAAIFGWFLPTINQSGFSQVCLLLPSLWDPLPASSRGRLASSRERLASPRSSPQPASPSLLLALPGVGMPRLPCHYDGKLCGGAAGGGMQGAGGPRVGLRGCRVV